MGQRTHYEVLGVTRSFTDAELKAAWQEKARACHPDKNGNPDEFAAASCAYATLRDRKNRQAYDAKMDLLTEPCGRCNGTGVTRKQKGFIGRVTSKCESCGGSGRA